MVKFIVGFTALVMLAVGFYFLPFLNSTKEGSLMPSPAVQQAEPSVNTLVPPNLKQEKMVESPAPPSNPSGVVNKNPAGPNQYLGNLQNRGHIALMDKDLIYSFTSVNILNANKNHPIIQVHALYLSPDNEWIYYIDQKDNKIYKIKKDGTGLHEISSDQATFLTLQKEWLYYTNMSDKYKLYKMKKDGTEKTKVTDEESDHFTFQGEWVYFSGVNGELVKEKLDGSGRQVISNDICLSIFISGEEIYYFNLRDKHVYKMGLDGSGIELVISGIVTGLNLDENWIYYSLEGQGVYRMQYDKSHIQQLTTVSGSGMNLTEDSVFFISNDNYKLMSMKKDGTDFKVIEDNSPPVVSDAVKEHAIDLVKKDLVNSKSGLYLEGVTAVEVSQVENDGRLQIHVYNFDKLENRTKTINWYTYDPKSGKLTSMFEKGTLSTQENIAKVSPRITPAIKKLIDLEAEGIKVIANQSLHTEFENWGKVRFVSGQKQVGKTAATFYLTDNNDNLLYTFPSYYGNQWGSLTEIQAISFKDVNDDGLKDIIIIAEYITGIGTTGTTPFPIASVFFQKDHQFVSIPELDKGLNKEGNANSVEFVLDYMKQKIGEINIHNPERKR